MSMSEARFGVCPLRFVFPDSGREVDRRQASILLLITGGLIGLAAEGEITSLLRG